MTNRLSGYQPQYFPRLHYFARMLNSDVFSIADYLQYVRKHAYPQLNGKRGVSYQAHTPVKTPSGILLLQVPVINKELQSLNEAFVNSEEHWQKKQLKTIQFNYLKAPNFKILFPELEELLNTKHNSLAALNIASIVWALTVLLEIPRERGVMTTLNDINEILPHAMFRLKKIILLSDTTIRPSDKSIDRDANDWIIDICKLVNADEYYYGGTSAESYADFDKYRIANVSLLEQGWKCKSYTQQHSGEFIPNLSILDLLLNVSPNEARKILSTPNQ